MTLWSPCRLSVKFKVSTFYDNLLSFSLNFVQVWVIFGGVHHSKSLKNVQSWVKKTVYTAWKFIWTPCHPYHPPLWFCFLSACQINMLKSWKLRKGWLRIFWIWQWCKGAMVATIYNIPCTCTAVLHWVCEKFGWTLQSQSPHCCGRLGPASCAEAKFNSAKTSRLDQNIAGISSVIDPSIEQWEFCHFMQWQPNVCHDQHVFMPMMWRQLCQNSRIFDNWKKTSCNQFQLSPFGPKVKGWIQVVTH